MNDEEYARRAIIGNLKFFGVVGGLMALTYCHDTKALDKPIVEPVQTHYVQNTYQK